MGKKIKLAVHSEVFELSTFVISTQYKENDCTYTLVIISLYKIDYYYYTYEMLGTLTDNSVKNKHKGSMKNNTTILMKSLPHTHNAHKQNNTQVQTTRV